MKKLILVLAMIACMSVANATEPQWQGYKGDTPHIEFKDFGLYGVVSYDFVKSMWIDGTYPMPTLQGATGVIGFQFRRQTGIGLGLSYLYDQNGLFTQMPLFIELRTNYLRSRFTPYTALQVGYSFALGNRLQQATDAWMMDQGGATLGILVGGRFAFTRKFGCSIGVGYHLLHANNMLYSDQNGVPAMNESVLLHNLRVNVALNF